MCFLAPLRFLPNLFGRKNFVDFWSFSCFRSNSAIRVFAVPKIATIPDSYSSILATWKFDFPASHWMFQSNCKYFGSTMIQTLAVQHPIDSFPPYQLAHRYIARLHVNLDSRYLMQCRWNDWLLKIGISKLQEAISCNMLRKVLQRIKFF